MDINAKHHAYLLVQRAEQLAKAAEEWSDFEQYQALMLMAIAKALGATEEPANSQLFV